MSSLWRTLSGPILTVAVVLAARLLQSFHLPVPNLGVVLLGAVMFSVLRGGWVSGVPSGVISVVAFAWLRSGGSFQFLPVDLARVLIDLTITIPVVIILARVVTRLERTAQRERALRQQADEAQNRATGILESISDGFFALDNDWRYVYVNAQAERLVGRNRDELLGSVIWDVFPALTGSRWDVEYHHAQQSGETVHFEEYYPPLDAWFETHAYPSAEGMSIYLRNVTGRLRAEQALQRRVLKQAALAHIGRMALAGNELQKVLDEATKRLATVFEVEMAKVLELQPDGQLLLRAGVGWKPGLVGSALVGASLQSQAGYTLLSDEPVVVEDLRAERRFSGPELLTSHDVISGMSVVIDGKSGPWGILAVHSTQRQKFDGDDVSFLAGTAQVLGLAVEWAQASRALRDSEQRFRQLAENIREVLFITDVHNREPGYISPAYEQVWGRSVDSWYQDPRSWLEAVHPEDRPRTEAALSDLADGSFEERFRIILPDGEIRWIRDRAFGVRNAQGEIERIVGIAEDVTASKQLSDEHAARAAAEAGVAARDEVLAAVSHDLRNPLNAMALAVDLLGQQGQLKEDSRSLGVIRRAVQQMQHLIADLLDMSRIERGQLTVERTFFEPGLLLRAVCDSFSQAAQKKSIQLIASADKGLPRVFADHERIQQALANLVQNALKFTPAGGTVWVEASAVNDQLRFTVSDTGPGIPAQQAPSIFERYWQAHVDRHGIGLGLPIVKGIADAHGGRVWVEPRPGGGSRFHLEIPAEQRRTTQSQESHISMS